MNTIKRARAWLSSVWTARRLRTLRAENDQLRAERDTLQQEVDELRMRRRPSE